MSIATNETDKQVGAILETLQDVAPEVLEQAVMYNQAMDIVCLGVLMPVVPFLVYWTYRLWKKAIGEDEMGWAILGSIAGFTAFIAGIVFVDRATDLFQSVFTPDFYAAECAARLGRMAIGS